MNTSIERAEDTSTAPMVLGYVRVTAAGQTSLPAAALQQWETIMGYCHRHDLRLVGIVQDLGVSGHDADSDGWRLPTDFARKSDGRIGGIVVARPSRLSRDVALCSKRIEELESAGITIASAIDDGPYQLDGGE